MDTSTDQYETIDEYIASFPEEVGERLRAIRQVVREEAPEAGETIKYRMPTFTLNGNLVHFAAFQNHIGFYPTPSAMEAFEKELSAYKMGKGSVQFPLDQPLPLSLIRRMVRSRVEENRAKRKKKSS